MEEAKRDGEWMAVEICGHRQHIGKVREVQRFGATMMEIAELQRDGTFQVLTYGPAAIFGTRVVTEEQARRQVLPKHWKACAVFVASKVLPTACETCAHDAAGHVVALQLLEARGQDTAARADDGEVWMGMSDLRPGAIFKTRDGDRAVKQYGSDGAGDFDSTNLRDGSTLTLSPGAEVCEIVIDDDGTADEEPDSDPMFWDRQ